MAAFSAFMSGGASKFQSLTDLHSVQGSKQALAKTQEDLNRNIANLKLWTDAYVHTPEDVKLAIELRDNNQWTASFSTGKSNPKAGKMKAISDKARPPLSPKFKRIAEIVEVKKKPTAIGQQREEGEQGGNDESEGKKGKKGKKGKGQRGKGSKVEWFFLTSTISVIRLNFRLRGGRALSEIAFIFPAFGLLLPVLKEAVHWLLSRSSIASLTSSGVCTYASVQSLRAKGKGERAARSNGNLHA